MFSEFLDGLIQKVEGTLGAAVMAMDGISIEKRLTDSSINIESLAAEYTSSLRSLSSTSQDAGLGTLEEFVVSTDQRIVAIRMITPEYFLFALLRKDATLGRARFELKRGATFSQKNLRFERPLPTDRIHLPSTHTTTIPSSFCFAQRPLLSLAN